MMTMTDTLNVDDSDHNANWIKRTAEIHGALLPEDEEPMTPEQIEWVRNQRTDENGRRPRTKK